MKSIRQEILEFVSTISNKEIKNNKNLRRRLKDLNRHLRDTYYSDNEEILKYLNVKMLTAKNLEN
jgi:hypothetical protein